MKVTFLGHATVLVEIDGVNLLFDPFISINPLASHIDVASIKADYICITHGHQDHILDVEDIAKRTGATLISNFEIVSWFEQKGLKGHGMNIGGKYSFDFGTVKYVNALHSSPLPDGTYGGNPGGFVVWTDEACIYIAGDTGLTEDMKLIPKICPKLDLAVLPVGDNFTMGFEDAAIASEYIQCDKILGYHYDTFPVIEIDHGKAKNHFKGHGKELLLLEVGEFLQLS